MGLTDFTSGFSRMSCYAHPRSRSDSGASRGRRTDLSGLAPSLRRGALANRTAACLQGGRPDLRANRVRGPRPRASHRRQGDPGRPRRAEKGGYQGSSLSCPHCRDAARFVSYRPRTVVSLLGPIRVCRAYYHCPHCHSGTAPGDAVMRLPEAALTPAAYEIACLAGVLSSFAEAATVTLPKMAGLRLAESTVERATEGAGRGLGQRLAAGATFGTARDWAWHNDAEGKTCAYLAVDATGVGQQGAGGAAAEGRMATVAMVYTPVPEARDRCARPDGRPPRFEARYLAGLDGLASLGEPLRRQAAQVGMDRAERWIALSDGGSGLEDWVRVNFGRVEAVILDFYHAAEYLGGLAKALHPSDEPARQRWLDGWW